MQKEYDEKTHKGWQPGDNQERDWIDVSISQRAPGIGGNFQKLGRGNEGFSCTGFRGSMALLISWFQTSSLHNCETMNFCGHKPPSVVLYYSSLRKLIQRCWGKLYLWPCLTDVAGVKGVARRYKGGCWAVVKFQTNTWRRWKWKPNMKM